MENTVRTKWLQFELKYERRRKTPIIWVYNRRGEYLGDIKWYPSWRQYCFTVEHDDSQQRPLKLVLAKSCLDDISEYIAKLMDERKRGRPGV